MKAIYFVAGLGILAGIYLWIVPPVKDYFADRRKADIEREQAIAEAETTLALERAKARLENICNADSVDFTTNTKSETDGGTRPNTTVTATITAKDGHFIYEPSIIMNRNGTREHKWTRSNTTPLPQVVGTSFENTILASASQSVRCEHYNPFATSSCTATSTISGKQLAIECIDFLIDKEREKITGN